MVPLDHSLVVLCVGKNLALDSFIFFIFNECCKSCRPLLIDSVGVVDPSD